MKKGLKRAVIGWVALSGVLTLSVFAWFLWGRGKPQVIAFPDDFDVERVSVEILVTEGITEAVPQFAVLQEYVAKVLNAFRPALRHDYPSQWDQRETIGYLLITKRDGETIKITESLDDLVNCPR